MKWYFILIALLSLACHRSYVTYPEEEIGNDILYVKNSYKPFTGKCVVVFKNTDIVKEQFTFRNGILNGEAIAWYKNGKIRRKGYYSKGHITGQWTFWDEEGNKSAEANYRQDSLHGQFLSLYSNGRIKEKGKFSHNKRTGKWLIYDENGRQIH
jgi:antitoxin component YwqK of YwqJK toxin-antitoxin module